MIKPETAVKTLQNGGVDFFAGVPDSLLKHFCAYIDDALPKTQHVITANEGGAVALAVGHYLATSNVPVVYMQNSGLGNAVNPILSLADSAVYSIPMLIIVGWRGEPGVKDEPQHIKQGPTTTSLFEAMDIPYTIMSDEESEAITHITTALTEAKKRQSPYALLVRKGTFTNYKINEQSVAKNKLPTREDVLMTVLENMPSDTVYVGTTGKLSRELFELREKRGEGHEKDFLTVGSMGHASQIALGIAEARPEKTIVCLDGDGAALMHLGGMATIGSRQPKNYIHIIINNGVHESVGGQSVTGSEVDYTLLAKSLGYKNAYVSASTEELSSILNRCSDREKPVLIDCKTEPGSRVDLGRPTTAPIDNKTIFMNFIGKSN